MTAADLKRLAEVLPKGCDARVGPTGILYIQDYPIHPGLSDAWNGQGTVALLDAMRKAEAEEVEALRADGSRDGARINQIREALDKITWRTLSTESVVAAALAVFGGESEAKEEG